MRKMDEMELQHTLQAIRGAYLFSIIFEVVCWISKCITAGVPVFTDMFYLIISQSVVLTIGQFYFKSKAGDSKGTTSIIFIVAVSIIALIIGLLATFLDR
ncbi:hypothetical protein [Dorea formicigenerans]|uniref:hypothetical protein n=1 Tax=Dorea formicigenerans TaxID=39486 RepID=UPI00156EC476|nr:hypothetical protein [Dorea formicigenerans]NSK21197.1 hypothetical protein [Dorea formicigenerans]